MGKSPVECVSSAHGPHVSTTIFWSAGWPTLSCSELGSLVPIPTCMISSPWRLRVPSPLLYSTVFCRVSVGSPNIDDDFIWEIASIRSR
jgi:hypothetical protein